MKIFSKYRILVPVVALVFLTSCIETVVVGSVTTAVVATREKSLNNTRYDVQIYTTLTSDFLQNGLKNFGNSIDITVNEGRVLLTGIARDVQKAKLASELAWKAAGVKEVIDEIQVRDGDSTHFRDYTSATYDYFITSKIETKLVFANNVSTFNYKLTTVNGTVYLIGVAQNQTELKRVTDIITNVRGVEKVVSHVIMINDRRRKS